MEAVEREKASLIDAAADKHAIHKAELERATARASVLKAEAERAQAQEAIRREEVSNDFPRTR